MRSLAFLLLLTVFFSCKKELPNVQTKVLGHAGETLDHKKSTYPPNTEASVLQAMNSGADGVEVDVQMTSDGQLVAFHDLTLDENTEATGCINSMFAAEVLDIKIYETDYKIESLTFILERALSMNAPIMLDVKHLNECTGERIDYSVFNSELNNMLSYYTNSQKQLITVNCRDHLLFNELTDTLIKLSLESDDAEFAIPLIESMQLDMITMKLDVVNQAIKDELDSKNIKLSIYNVKTRKNNKTALKYDPEFVISDNIECTLKAING